MRKPNALCSSDINRDFDGNWDLAEKCASFVDTGGPIVCHNTDQATLYSGAQSFTTHGKRVRAAEDQLCWFPNTAMGARIGQCSRDECKLPGQLTSAPVCGNGGIDLERSVIVAPRPATLAASATHAG